jgi:hypothetical protein
LILAALSTFVALAVTGARSTAATAPAARTDAGPVILTDDPKSAADEPTQQNDANHPNADHLNANDPNANDPVGR